MRLREIAILQQIDVSIERLLADFRWQSIGFVDALDILYLFTHILRESGSGYVAIFLLPW